MHNFVPGGSESDNTSVARGLVPGEVVVTDGVDKLQQGSKVEARVLGDKPAIGGKPVAKQHARAAVR